MKPEPFPVEDGKQPHFTEVPFAEVKSSCRECRKKLLKSECVLWENVGLNVPEGEPG
jgi:hypothetical protein